MAAIHSLHAKPLMSHTATGRPDVERQLFSFFSPPYIFFFLPPLRDSISRISSEIRSRGSRQDKQEKDRR